MATDYRNDFTHVTKAFLRATERRHKSYSGLGYNTYQDAFPLEDSDNHGPSKVTRFACYNNTLGDITFLMSMQVRVISSGATFQLYSKVPIKSQSIFLAIGNSNPFYLDSSDISLMVKFETVSPYNQPTFTGAVQWIASLERWYR